MPVKLIGFVLLLAFTRDQARDRRSRNLDFDVVRFHAQNQRVVFVNGDDGADDSSAGGHGVAILETRQHFLRVLFLALHGKEQEKIKDSENQKDREQSHEGGAGRRRLQKKV